MVGYLGEPAENSGAYAEPPCCKWCDTPLASTEIHSGRWECDRCYDEQHAAHCDQSDGQPDEAHEWRDFDPDC